MLAATSLGPPIVVELRADEVEGARLQLLARAARAKSERRRRAAQSWLEEVREVLHRRVPACPSLSELAWLAGVHRTHLARSFKREFGVTVAQYTRALRVEWAAVQLRSTDAALGELAREACFADQSHFTRVFKRHMGTTPGAFRQAARAS